MVPYAAAFKGDNNAFQFSPITRACKRDGVIFFRIKNEPSHRFLSNSYFLKTHRVTLSAVAGCKDDSSFITGFA